MLKYLATVFLCVLFFMPKAYSDEFGGGMGGMGGHGGKHMRGQGGMQEQNQGRSNNLNTDNLRVILSYDKELNLSESQVQQIKQLRSDAMREYSKLMEDLAEMQSDINTYLGKDTPDFASARKKLDEASAAAIKAQQIPFDAFEKAYNVLDDAQKGKLNKIRAVDNKKSGDGPAQGQMNERMDINHP